MRVLSELRIVSRVDVNMTSTSGIRASGSGSSEYVKTIVLKDKASYGSWRTKITEILDAEDCLEIINGTEIEPPKIAEVQDDLNVPANITEVEKRHVEIKDWRRRRGVRKVGEVCD